MDRDYSSNDPHHVAAGDGAAQGPTRGSIQGSRDSATEASVEGSNGFWGNTERELSVGIPDEADAENSIDPHAESQPSSEVPRFIAPTLGGVDILKLLTELEDQIEHTRKGPFGTMIGFDEDRFHTTIMKIRANLPEEMKRAAKLVREQERIVEETLATSERIKQDARQTAQAEQERGRREVGQLREQARLESERLRAEAQEVLAVAHATAEREVARILEEAHRQAEQVVEDARHQAAFLVSDSEILQQAQVIAQDIDRRAHEEADAVRHGADDYARDVLANLESVLNKATLQIQRGREFLERDR